MTTLTQAITNSTDESIPSWAINEVNLTGTLVERSALRYSPAGVAILEGRLQHCSEQEEAGLNRRIECEIPLIALGENAKWLQTIATPVKIQGFITAKSANVKQLILHVTKIEFIEGIKGNNS